MKDIYTSPLAKNWSQLLFCLEIMFEKHVWNFLVRLYCNKSWTANSCCFFAPHHQKLLTPLDSFGKCEGKMNDYLYFWKFYLYKFYGFAYWAQRDILTVSLITLIKRWKCTSFSDISVFADMPNHASFMLYYLSSLFRICTCS